MHSKAYPTILSFLLQLSGRHSYVRISYDPLLPAAPLLRAPVCRWQHVSCRLAVSPVASVASYSEFSFFSLYPSPVGAYCSCVISESLEWCSVDRVDDVSVLVSGSL